MIYVIGEQHGNLDAYHSTSLRLAEFLGTTEREMLERVVWLNMFETRGTTPRLLAQAIERAAQKGDAILLLGRRVAVGWALGHLGALASIRRDDGPVIVAVPHPSGRNRWWNDPDHRADAELVLSALWRLHR